ncbi:lysine transporter LysE [Paractinoplanes deccanensis]|uniref:Lysine transporter LysE n=1 Tax=Paractinoplanes deccanensis TaxID=113561 RepID=A0ABQ3Y342_9ACTN|nr:LysE family translocator [Actinoplanes deccanensis]GID74419.1 lysine transporter LysE [Actinoplanes deccanensis]
MINWPGFAVAAVLASLIPGANQLLGLRHAVRFGAPRAVIGLGGRLTALLVMSGVVVAGLGAVVAASSRALLVIKLVGVVYLAWLGVATIRGARAVPDQAESRALPREGGGAWRLARTEFAVTISNPKAFLLFAALFPQFTTSTGAALSRDVGLLGLAYMAVELVCGSGYILVGAGIGAFGMAGRTRLWVDRVTGVVLLALAMALSFQHLR